jgi:hypothetical protein
LKVSYAIAAMVPLFDRYVNRDNSSSHILEMFQSLLVRFHSQVEISTP